MAEEEVKKEAEAKAEAAEEAKAGEAGETPVPPVEEGEASESEKQAEPEKAAEPEKQAEPEKPAKPSEPDWKSLYALTLADFDNYKKRAARDREDTYRYAEMDILKDVLPAVDNLSLALSSAKDKEDAFVKGVQLVYDTLLKSLKEHGAEPFDSVGKELDTEKMEAIATLPSDDIPEGKVSIESKKGWMLKDKVLRAAQVVVSSGKPA
ncbi:MAG: nucleotide exchange factor GrpE [Lentisphaerae bacterium]|jgi:molecular chaperone GrpE|nr:nucleotide exchange factor GrpE [Lentisphaerota bacterium]